STATWNDISSATRAGTGFIAELDIDFAEEVPSHLGLTDSDDITVAIEGELYLEGTGAWRFELDANDKGFVEIAAPGADFTRVVAAENNSVESVTYNVTAPGWHRMRAAFADTSTNMDFRLRADSPLVSGGLRDFESDQIRARVDDLNGFVADGFEDGYLIDYRASTLADGTLNGEFGADPLGLLLGSASWSMRWSGQVLIDVEGDYVFNVESFQGSRMWIDGSQVAAAFDDNPHNLTTQLTHLDPGWHDVAIDLTKEGDSSPSVLRVHVESGPAWVGETIPADHVRPVMGRQVRWSAMDSSTDVPVPEGGSGSRLLLIDVPANATPLAIQAAYEVDHPVRASVSVVLDPPVGGNITLLAAGSEAGAGVFYRYATVPAANFGDAFTFIVTDTNALDLQTGVLSFAGITLLHGGGTAPFPTTYRYESAVRDLGEVVARGTVRYTLRKLDQATVQVRTCDSAAACASEPWVDVAYGTLPSAPTRRFAQYAVEMTSDGDIATGLDSIELSYSVLAGTAAPQ
ncbi:MAG TPA: PA14 domain-containing protein, partial [Kofleriaceae bacterium]